MGARVVSTSAMLFFANLLRTIYAIRHVMVLIKPKTQLRDGRLVVLETWSTDHVHASGRRRMVAPVSHGCDEPDGQTPFFSQD